MFYIFQYEFPPVTQQWLLTIKMYIFNKKIMKFEEWNLILQSVFKKIILACLTNDLERPPTEK